MLQEEGDGTTDVSLLAALEKYSENFGRRLIVIAALEKYSEKFHEFLKEPFEREGDLETKNFDLARSYYVAAVARATDLTKMTHAPLLRSVAVAVESAKTGQIPAFKDVAVTLMNTAVRGLNKTQPLPARQMDDLIQMLLKTAGTEIQELIGRKLTKEEHAWFGKEVAGAVKILEKLCTLASQLTFDYLDVNKGHMLVCKALGPMEAKRTAYSNHMLSLHEATRTKIETKFSLIHDHLVRTLDLDPKRPGNLQDMSDAERLALWTKIRQICVDDLLPDDVAKVNYDPTRFTVDDEVVIYFNRLLDFAIKQADDMELETIPHDADAHWALIDDLIFYVMDDIVRELVERSTVARTAHEKAPLVTRLRALTTPPVKYSAPYTESEPVTERGKVFTYCLKRLDVVEDEFKKLRKAEIEKRKREEAAPKEVKPPKESKRRKKTTPAKRL